MQIAARKKDWPKEKASVTVEYPLPATFAELVTFLGEEVVYSKAVDSLVIDVQSNMRRIISNPKTSDEQKATALAALVGYKPAAGSAVRRSPTEKVGDLVEKMSDDDKKALVKRLRDELAAAKS